MIDNPLIGRVYEFVRIQNGFEYSVMFKRSENGSASLLEGAGGGLWHESAQPWKLALAVLKARGFRPKESSNSQSRVA
ncbi:MAG TPA: hypothetical protein VKB78_16365 [Pirellulales bacterium]|nr:hypothetical protein [Pirellulales bacterium]